MIFLDLDDFLIGWAHDPDITVSLGKELITFSVNKQAHNLISKLQEFSPVGIMSAGTEAYTKAINAHCKFVNAENIIARESFMTQEFKNEHAMDASWVATAKGLYPNAILMDHQKVSDEILSIKLDALGIAEDRYIQGPYFAPRYDVLSDAKIEELVTKAKEILQNTK